MEASTTQERTLLLMQSMLDAQSSKIDLMHRSIIELQRGFNELKCMYTQTSSSGSGQFVCPMNCGAEFIQVVLAVFCRGDLTVLAGEIFVGSPAQIMQNKQAAVTSRETGV